VFAIVEHEQNLPVAVAEQAGVIAQTAKHPAGTVWADWWVGKLFAVTVNQADSPPCHSLMAGDLAEPGSLRHSAPDFSFFLLGSHAPRVREDGAITHARPGALFSALPRGCLVLNRDPEGAMPGLGHSVTISRARQSTSSNGSAAKDSKFSRFRAH
jgi:hypothetical protein